MDDVSWITKEFKKINCNDERLNARFIKVAQSMMESPGKNIHHAMDSWADSKGAYRLFDNERLKREEILKTHRENTLLRLEGIPRQACPASR